MKIHLLLHLLIATEIHVASTANPQEGQGLRGVNSQQDRALRLRRKDNGGDKGGGKGGDKDGKDDTGNNGEGPKRESSGRVIICRKTETKLKKDGKKDNEINDIRSRGMGEIKKKKMVFESRGEGDFQVVEVGRGKERSFINSLKSGPNKDLFEFVEEDFIYPIEATTNDPLLAQQYHHGLMQSEEAWDIATGSSSVTVGICDTGLQLDHPDLAANRLPGYHATQQCWEGDPTCAADVSAVHPHGTNCAGCAAAIGNNEKGVAGIGWSFRHRPGRVSDDPGGGASSAVLADCAR